MITRTLTASACLALICVVAPACDSAPAEQVVATTPFMDDTTPLDTSTPDEMAVIGEWTPWGAPAETDPAEMEPTEWEPSADEASDPALAGSDGAPAVPVLQEGYVGKAEGTMTYSKDPCGGMDGIEQVVVADVWVEHGELFVVLDNYPVLSGKLDGDKVSLEGKQPLMGWTATGMLTCVAHADVDVNSDEGVIAGETREILYDNLGVQSCPSTSSLSLRLVE